MRAERSDHFRTGRPLRHAAPANGAADGEDILAALRREILEETGCACERIRELGMIRENRASQDCAQESYYFIVWAAGCGGAPSPTTAEKASGTAVQWRSFDEMLALIRDTRHDTTQKKYLQARDLAALKECAARGCPK